MTGGVEVDASVDDQNNWTVEVDDRDLADSLAESFAATVDGIVEADGVGHLPDLRNAYAEAILQAYPASVIVSGRYRNRTPATTAPVVL